MILDGAITSPYDNLEDTLSHRDIRDTWRTTESGELEDESHLPARDKMKALGLVPWFNLFQAAAYSPKQMFALPIYPFTNQKYHDGDRIEERIKAWGASSLVHPRSAKYANAWDSSVEIAKSQITVRQPFTVLTELDKICKFYGQRRITKLLREKEHTGRKFSWGLEIATGHRWFTSPDKTLELIANQMHKHYRTSLERRVH